MARRFDAPGVCEAIEAVNWFMEKYAGRIMPEANSGCWLWIGGTTTGGYGLVAGAYAHRSSFEATNGEGTATGLFVRHKCDTPACVNPDHLLIGTAQDNTNDMIERGRQNPPRGEDAGLAKLTTEEVVAIRRRYGAGEKGTHLAKAYGVTPQNIQDVATGVTWAHVPGAVAACGHRRGENLTQAKLTTPKVVEIKRRLKAGEKQKDIAEVFGVRPVTITAIANGYNWKHVTIE